MRFRLVPLVLVLAVTGAPAAGGRHPDSAPQPAAAQEPAAQPPTFREGVDVLTVDVVALDSSGRPVADLTAADFTIRVNGEPRRVLSADFVQMDAVGINTGAAQPAGAPRVTLGLPEERGRRIVLAVDHLEIRPGTITPLLDAAARFIDGLTPRDQAAFITFPPPGPRTDFTNDKAVLQKALQGLVGRGSDTRPVEHNIGIAEALTIQERESALIPSQPESLEDFPPTMREVIKRNCLAILTEPTEIEDLAACGRELRNQASVMALKARSDATLSLKGIASIVEGLAAVEGPKSLVLVSPGLMVNNESDIQKLIRLAESSRVTVYVLAVEPDRDDVRADRVANTQGPTTVADRALAMEGLQAISSPGGFYNVAGTGDVIFQRIAVEMSAYYLLAVESRDGDAARERRAVSVDIQRRGVRSRASLAFLPGRPAGVARTPDDPLRDALVSGSAAADVPLAIATFAQRERQGGKIRVNLFAHVGTPGAPAAEYSVGYAVVDAADAVVTTATTKQALAPAGTSQPLQFGTAVVLDPGVYTLRFGVVDGQGRRGTIVRELNIADAAGGIGTSDLIVANRPATGTGLRPSVNPLIDTGQLAMYLELYAPAPEDLEWATVDLEIAGTADGPALATESAAITDGAQPSWRVASGVVDVSALAPGRYVARARVIQDRESIRVVTQPFTVGRASPGATPPAAR
jgi:VWFA-related protein